MLDLSKAPTVKSSQEDCLAWISAAQVELRAALEEGRMGHQTTHGLQPLSVDEKNRAMRVLSAKRAGNGVSSDTLDDIAALLPLIVAKPAPEKKAASPKG